MCEIKLLWENDGWEFVEKEESYQASKKDGILEKVIRFNKENKRFYPFYVLGGKNPEYSNVKPMWVDENTLKLIRKTARILKWKI